MTTAAVPRTVLLIHAFPLSSEMWTAQKAALEAAGLQVLTPNLPGFGGEAGELLGLDQAARLLLDQLPIEPVSVVGLSMGGYIALELLALAPERVGRLVLADTHAQGDDEATTQSREEQAVRVLKEGPGFMIGKAEQEQAPATAAQTRRMTLQASREGIAAALRAMAARPDRRDTLRAAAERGLPVLALVGTQDDLTPPEQAREMARLSGGQVTELAAAGHLSNLDQPEAFNQALLDFLL
ncbi:alpha/beta fold hydrolase [Deinococcus lacus]|uniref:Alpha/beta fold hydrolase n=1 Tax=Deinococcus lacus TaxID=392561 RepID=A0ABW1YG39_9DEIO